MRVRVRCNEDWKGMGGNRGERERERRDDEDE
jgi:hypothetical protein